MKFREYYLRRTSPTRGKLCPKLPENASKNAIRGEKMKKTGIKYANFRFFGIFFTKKLDERMRTYYT